MMLTFSFSSIHLPRAEIPVRASSYVRQALYQVNCTPSLILINFIRTPQGRKPPQLQGGHWDSSPLAQPHGLCGYTSSLIITLTLEGGLTTFCLTPGLRPTPFHLGCPLVMTLISLPCCHYKSHTGLFPSILGWCCPGLICLHSPSLFSCHCVIGRAGGRSVLPHLTV